MEHINVCGKVLKLLEGKNGGENLNLETLLRPRKKIANDPSLELKKIWSG